MLTVAICDDNKLTLTFLEREIGTLLREREIEYNISTFSSGKIFLEEHKKPILMLFFWTSKCRI